jgi:hypothetical protein
MIQDLALHFNITHNSSLLKILVENDALQPHFVLIIGLFGMIIAFIPTNQIEQYQTEIVAQVIMLLVPDNMMIAGELNLILLNQLSQVPNQLPILLFLDYPVLLEEAVSLILQAQLQFFEHLLIATLLGLNEEYDLDLGFL